MNWEESLSLYEKLIAKFPEVERKGKTMPYTSANGNMYSFIDKQGEMGLQLSEEDRNNFIEEHKTQLMEQHGRTMKEYVHVPQDLIKNTKKLSAYFEKSIAYTSGLKAKPSKKKK